MDLLIEEKRSGVTEWLLSKPVMRRAYVLAKLAANLAHILLFLVVLPAGLIFGLLSLRGGSLFPPLPFLTAAGIMALHVTFYVALTILLGTAFNSRAPVLGIAFGSLLGGSLIGSFVEPLLYVTPWILPKVSTALASSHPMPGNMMWFPVAFTALWSVVFILAAVYRFDQEEF
jgi:ABC-type transport system involved in multi-copper enzyme maturation permease subunit